MSAFSWHRQMNIHTDKMASSAHGGARPKTRIRAPPHYERISHYNIDRNDKNKLGEGITGNVYPAIDLRNNKEVAAKKITVEKEFFDPDVYEHEFDILFHKVPHHENIIKMYELFKEEYVHRRIPMIDIWLISEICEQGNLADYAQENDLSSEDKLELFYQSALALRHLHQENVVHRDVKPQNILVTKPEESDIPTIKLCDFGTARAVVREDGRSLTMKSLAGTRLYTAPEQTEMQGGKFSYNRKVDLFSLGVTALALLDSSIGSVMKPRILNREGLGVAMWRNRSVKGFKVPIDKSSDNPLEKETKTIIKEMIAFKAEDRPSIEDVVESLSKLRKSSSHKRKDKPIATVPETSKEVLVAMDGGSLWVRQGSRWMKQQDHPSEELNDFGKCWCAVGNDIIAAGGYVSHNVVPDCYRFCLTTRRWSRLPDMITARFYPSAAVLGDVMMVAGGDDLYECEKFHIRDRVWRSTASSLMSLGQKPLLASAARKLFVLNRFGSMPPGTRLQQYNPTDDRFTWAAAIPHYVKDIWRACLVSVAELLYLLGGDQRLTVQYNPATDQWVQLLSSPLNTYTADGCCAVVHAGKILLCGGSTDVDWCKMIEEYDPVKKQWAVVDFHLPFWFSLYPSHVASAHMDVPKE